MNRLNNISNTLSSSTNTQQSQKQQLIQYNSSATFPKLLLNRPKSLNSLNLQMVRSLSKHLQQIKKYPAFWMQGNGNKSFCAGGDVKVLFEGGAKLQERQQFFREQFQLDYHLATLSNTIQVANWDGIVMGGGVGLTHFAQFKIATQSTLFAMPQSKIGFFVDVGAGKTLAELKSNIGMFLGLAAGKIKGEEAYLSGLATHFLEKKDVQIVYKEIQERLSKKGNAKEIISKVLKKYHKDPTNKKIQNQEQIDHIFGGKTVAEIFQRAKNSATPFGKSTYTSLQSVCPLSIYAIFKLINQSKTLSKKEIFKRDFILSQNFIANQNFNIGVTSLLITKDNNPKWTHKSIEEVTQKQIDALFAQNPTKKPLQI